MGTQVLIIIIIIFAERQKYYVKWQSCQGASPRMSNNVSQAHWIYGEGNYAELFPGPHFRTRPDPTRADPSPILYQKNPTKTANIRYINLCFSIIH